MTNNRYLMLTPCIVLQTSQSDKNLSIHTIQSGSKEKSSPVKHPSEEIEKVWKTDELRHIGSEGDFVFDFCLLIHCFSHF